MIFGYNAKKIRKDFPILEKKIIYLDSACMSLKPRQVIEKMNEYYNEYSACAGRSSHKLSERLEEEIAKAREEVSKFINAGSSEEIIFTRNTTEGINLIANSIGLKKGDEVIISDKEHNSNLIPWLKLKKQAGINLIICRSNGDNTFNIDNFKKCFTKKTKLVSIVHSSNIDGVENPIKEIAQIAHSNKALLLVDGAQSAPHKEINVRKLEADFFAFSGHKMLGPTGTGVLYGRKKLLESMEQFIVGGETVLNSTYSSYIPENLPNKFEAGLSDYAGIIGLGEACRYLSRIGMKNIEVHEIKLNKLLTELLKNEKRIEIIGPSDAEKRGGIFSFNIKNIDPHHVSRILNASRNIMIRSGAHCVHSWFNAHNMKGSARVSFYLYNTDDEVRIFAEEIKRLCRVI